MTDEKKQTALGLEILASGYTMVPAFWTKLILDGHDSHIPASFWKFLFVLWRDVVGINAERKGFTARKTMNDFGMRPASAMKWAASLAASGLFSVKYGQAHSRQAKGEPTIYTYLNGTETEWSVFIRCLSSLCKRDKKDHHDAGGIPAYRAALTVLIAIQKKKEGITPLLSDENRRFLNECERRGLIRREPNTQPLDFDGYWFSRSRPSRVGVLNTEEQLDYFQITLDEDCPSVNKALQDERRPQSW